MSFICAVKRVGCIVIVWVRWVKAGLIEKPCCGESRVPTLVVESLGSRLGCTCMGERRDHAAQGRAEQVGPVLGKWHRAGSACIARVRLAAQVRLVRGEGGSFAAQITGLQRVRLAAGEACGQLRLARERGRGRLLVGHLDQSGLLRGGSTVAWGRRGDRVRLHVFS